MLSRGGICFQQIPEPLGSIKTLMLIGAEIAGGNLRTFRKDKKFEKKA